MHKCALRLPCRPRPACLAFAVSAFLCLLHVSGTARADDGVAAPSWTFAGYGSAGMVYSSERQADYQSDSLNPGDAGYTRRISPHVDSRIGAQLVLNIDSDWSATLQLLSERSLIKSYRPMLEWANLAYRITPGFTIRLGRIAMPMFLAGDYRKAGYALPWLRPPVEAYGALALSSSDGIDASYRWNTMGTNNVTQAYFGTAAIKINDSGAYARERGIAGLSHTLTRGELTLRASAVTAVQTINLVQALFDAFRQFGPQGAALADTYELDHKRALVGVVGASYDPGNWFLMSEASRYNTRSFVGDRTAYYATAGWRIGNIAPYLTYSKVKSNGPTRDNGLNLAALPAQAAPAAAYLNGQLNGLLSKIPIQHTVSTGVRWDLAANRALKAQYDRLRPQGGSAGTLVNIQPGFTSGHAVHVLSAVLDFVF